MGGGGPGRDGGKPLRPRLIGWEGRVRVGRVGKGRKGRDLSAILGF